MVELNLEDAFIEYTARAAAGRCLNSFPGARTMIRGNDPSDCVKELRETIGFAALALVVLAYYSSR